MRKGGSGAQSPFPRLCWCGSTEPPSPAPPRVGSSATLLPTAPEVPASSTARLQKAGGVTAASCSEPRLWERRDAGIVVPAPHPLLCVSVTSARPDFILPLKSVCLLRKRGSPTVSRRCVGVGYGRRRRGYRGGVGDGPATQEDL